MASGNACDIRYLHCNVANSFLTKGKKTGKDRGGGGGGEENYRRVKPKRKGKNQVLHGLNELLFFLIERKGAGCGGGGRGRGVGEEEVNL